VRVELAAEQQPARRESQFRALGTVLWAFLGIRKGDASRADLSSLKPWQVLAAGVILAVVFVAVLVTLVRTIAG
jgi:hypothetical protein